MFQRAELQGHFVWRNYAADMLKFHVLGLAISREMNWTWNVVEVVFDVEDEK